MIYTEEEKWWNCHAFSLKVVITMLRYPIIKSRTESKAFVWKKINGDALIRQNFETLIYQDHPFCLKMKHIMHPGLTDWSIQDQWREVNSLAYARIDINYTRRRLFKFLMISEQSFSTGKSVSRLFLGSYKSQLLWWTTLDLGLLLQTFKTFIR